MTQPATMPAQLGRYRILKPLGQGGMGSVYLAEDTVLCRRVAVKVPLLDKAEGVAVRERFAREARAAAAIKHPNVCPLLDVGEDNGLPFLVMEFIEGTPLAERSEAGHPWPVQRAVTVVRELALAVGELHQRGLVHRDLKPSNVMLRPDGQPVLMDFGLARSFTADTTLVTASGTVVGSPPYMAPEQVRGDGKSIGPATDAYALGVILYRLLTGTFPFQGPPATLYGQILHAPPEPASTRRPGLDPGLDAICLRALAKEPAQRFASMAELAAALAPFAGNSRSGATEVLGAAPPTEFGSTMSPACPTRIRGRWRGRAWLWAAGIVLLAGLVWVGVALWPKERGDTGRRPEPDPTKGTPLSTALPEEFTNSIGMKLVLVKPGRFQMGCPPGEEGTDVEKPQHWVEMTRSFYVGVTEVTQEQYEQVTGANPSHFTPTGKGKDYVQRMDTRRFPVENVSWDDAVEFCRRLAAREKDRGHRYRLPTEAEWEYACRGGHKYKKSAPFYFLEPAASLDGTRANFDGSRPYGGAAKTPLLHRTAPVGSYPPNALGLYDMHGNVYEWCADDKRTYHQEDIKDPAGNSNTSRHIIRGGSWGNTGKECRAAHRAEYNPRAPRGFPQLGFRVVGLP